MEISEKSSEITKLQNEVVRLSEDKSQLQDRVNELEKSAQEHYKNLLSDQTNRRLESILKESQMDKLRAELNQAKKENLELNNQLSDKAIQIKELEKQKNDQERENNELLKENENLNEFKRQNIQRKNIQEKIFKISSKFQKELQAYLQGQENNSKDSTYTGLDSPDSSPNSAPLPYKRKIRNEPFNMNFSSLLY